jgi:hypothetical protein
MECRPAQEHNRLASVLGMLASSNVRNSILAQAHPNAASMSAPQSHLHAPHNNEGAEHAHVKGSTRIGSHPRPASPSTIHEEQEVTMVDDVILTSANAIAGHGRWC